MLDSKAYCCKRKKKESQIIRVHGKAKASYKDEQAKQDFQHDRFGTVS